AAGFLDDDRFDAAPRSGDAIAQPIAIEAFATQRNKQHRADVGMRAKTLEHGLRVIAGIATGEADHLHFAAAEVERDLAGDEMRALHEIDDEDDVADALAAIAAQVSLHRPIIAC